MLKSRLQFFSVVSVLSFSLAAQAADLTGTYQIQGFESDCVLSGDPVVITQPIPVQIKKGYFYGIESGTVDIIQNSDDSLTLGYILNDKQQVVTFESAQHRGGFKSVDKCFEGFCAIGLTKTSWSLAHDANSNLVLKFKRMEAGVLFVIPYATSTSVTCLFKKLL